MKIHRVAGGMFLAIALWGCATPYQSSGYRGGFEDNLSDSSTSSTALAANNSQWLLKCINNIETIKVGSTRADLLKAFSEAGGISNRSQASFVYREDRHIMIDVEFELNGNKTSNLLDPMDKITKITKPYLDSSPPID